jgi:crotonobetainyl-CoA:carnitine CoA-transferase CaiB-like acyl-CoA transferase
MVDCKTAPFLKPYRILDLAEGGCMIGGRILGDLGADVIKIEPPGGSPSRNSKDLDTYVVQNFDFFSKLFKEFGLIKE